MPRRNLRSRLVAFLREEDGSSAIEFVIFIPLVFMLVMSCFETGWLMAKTMMLERAVSMTARDLRVGLIEEVTHDNLKDIICDRALIFADCKNVLAIDSFPVGNSFGSGLGGSLSEPATCVDRSEDEPLEGKITPGKESENMLIRVCVIVDPIMPGIGVGLALRENADEAGGGFQMVAYEAFVTEPN